MICIPCSIAADAGEPTGHEKCLGNTWCDCQHKPNAKLVVTEETKDENGPSTTDESGAASSSSEESS